MDPPWRNTQCDLKYQTLYDENIKQIPMKRIQKKGYLFLWVTKSKLEVGLQMMKDWSYTYIELVVWVKVDDEGNINSGPGHYFDRSSEICLVGRKGSPLDLAKKQVLHSIPDTIISKLEEL